MLMCCNAQPVAEDVTGTRWFTLNAFLRAQNLMRHATAPASRAVFVHRKHRSMRKVTVSLKTSAKVYSKHCICYNYSWFQTRGEKKRFYLHWSLHIKRRQCIWGHTKH